MDDIDRQCCMAMRKVLIENLPNHWSVVDETHHDPNITLVVENDIKGLVGQPTVTVEIKWGKIKC